MKFVKLQTNGEISLLDFPGQVDVSWYADQIGCEWIELVYPKGFPIMLIVDEEGLLKENWLNYYASYLYGMHIHGQPIAGDALIASTSESGEIEGLPDEEAERWMKSLKRNYNKLREVLGEQYEV